VKKPSVFISNAAEALATNLKQKYDISNEDLNSFLQAELFKIVIDYTQYYLTAPKENQQLTEYEMLLVKHKNKQAFLTAYCQRTEQDSSVAEKLYNKVRQKLT
jgi:hypothetical protein